MIPDGHWLATGRLALRRMRPDDLDWYAALYADPEVTRFLGGVRTRTQAEEMFRERVCGYYADHPGLGIWMTTERATGVPVGFHLLNNIQGDVIIQLGYALLKPAWGRGYATEMSLPLVHYAFTALGLRRMAGITSPGHTASLRVLEKAGLERRGERTFAAYADAGPLAWFEIERDVWLARHPQAGSSYASRSGA